MEPSLSKALPDTKKKPLPRNIVSKCDNKDLLRFCWYVSLQLKYNEFLMHFKQSHGY